MEDPRSMRDLEVKSKEMIFFPSQPPCSDRRREPSSIPPVAAVTAPKLLVLCDCLKLSFDLGGDVLSTLKPDERKVVGAFKVHGGTYLQKFITRETSLSRLKTHRIVATLAERGIVLVGKQGSTNQVSLAKWFLDAME
jgi:hypothetical protein